MFSPYKLKGFVALKKMEAAYLKRRKPVLSGHTTPAHKEQKMTKLNVVTPGLLRDEFIQIGEAAKTERCDALLVLLKRQAGHLLHELCAMPGVPKLNLLQRTIAVPMHRNQPCEAFEAAAWSWLPAIRKGFSWEVNVRTLGEHGALYSTCRCIAAICDAMNTDGEVWSTPMSKNQMARRLRMKRNAFLTFAKTASIKPIGRQLWSLRLDRLDATSRGRLTGAADLHTSTRGV